MADGPTLTQQAAFGAKVQSLSETIAKKIAALPADQREIGLTMIHRNYAAELKESGMDNEHGHKWLGLQMDAIRRLIAEIEASGDKAGPKLQKDCWVAASCSPRS